MQCDNLTVIYFKLYFQLYIRSILCVYMNRFVLVGVKTNYNSKILKYFRHTIQFSA